MGTYATGHRIHCAAWRVATPRCTANSYAYLRKPVEWEDLFARRSARQRRASKRIPTVGLRAALVFRNVSIGPQASGDLLDLAAAVRAQCGVGGRAAIIQTQIRKCLVHRPDAVRCHAQGSDAKTHQ